jgi:hypothetical protein
MPKRKYVIQRLRVRKNASLAEVYAAAREQFSAADLQSLLDPEPTVTGDQLLADLEAVHREETRKKRKK